jgi:hypothetical protein
MDGWTELSYEELLSLLAQEWEIVITSKNDKIYYKMRYTGCHDGWARTYYEEES